MQLKQNSHIKKQLQALNILGLTQKLSRSSYSFSFGDAKGEGVLGVLGGSFFHNSV